MERFYVVQCTYLREIYSILTEDTGRHSLPGKIRLGRDFTWYFREIYSLMTQDTRKQTLTIPGKIRLVRDFTLYRRQFSPTKIKWNGDLALIIKANYFKKFTLSHWTPNDGGWEFPLYMEEMCLPYQTDRWKDTGVIAKYVFYNKGEIWFLLKLLNQKQGWAHLVLKTNQF